MDLNYLFERHQASLAMARTAGSERARAAHCELASASAERIADALPSGQAVTA